MARAGSKLTAEWGEFFGPLGKGQALGLVHGESWGKVSCAEEGAAGARVFRGLRRLERGGLHTDGCNLPGAAGRGVDLMENMPEHFVWPNLSAESRFSFQQGAVHDVKKRNPPKRAS